MKVSLSLRIATGFALLLLTANWKTSVYARETAQETQITHAPHGHILTNTAVWSHDGEWIVYDVRSDAAGDQFDGQRIERVHCRGGQIQVLYTSRNQAFCGVATASPTDDRVVFIHGPEHPTADWQYAAFHRRGAVVRTQQPGVVTTLDARNIDPPFTPGALRGGTHVHTFSGDGKWIAFTYEDHVLAKRNVSDLSAERNQRNVGVSVPERAVSVPTTHPRNHNGSHFTVLVTETTNKPLPGSDQISRAFSDAWVGSHGYLRNDGTQQAKAIAFQGLVATEDHSTIAEVYIVDLPADLTQPPPAGTLEGTETTRPRPPAGVQQRRLTYTQDRKFPGIQGPRHWLRSSPDGSRIAFLMRDDAGTVQLWTVSPLGGPAVQLSRNQDSIASAFTWSPDGQWIAHVLDQSVCVTSAKTGETIRLTKSKPQQPIRPEACVFSPDGQQLAYVRQVTSEAIGKDSTNSESGSSRQHNQIFVATLPGEFVTD